MAMNEKLVVPYDFTVAVGPEITNNLRNERLGRTAPCSGIVVDLGSIKPVDTIALLATDFHAETIWLPRLYDDRTAVDAGAPTVGRVQNLNGWPSPEAGKRYHRQALCMFDAPVMARYVRIDTSHPHVAGRLVIGNSFTAEDTMDVGFTFKVVDKGERREAGNALSNTTIRGKVLEYNWVWSWMTEQEARGPLLDLNAQVGMTRDLLCVLNPDAADLHNMIGYGPIVEEVTYTNVAGGAEIDNAYEARFRLQSRLILNL